MENDTIFEALQGACRGATLCKDLAQDISLTLDLAGGIDDTARALIGLQWKATDATEGAIYNLREIRRLTLIERESDTPEDIEREKDKRLDDAGLYLKDIDALQRDAAGLVFKSGNKVLRDCSAVLCTNQIEADTEYEKAVNAADPLAAALKGAD